MTEYRRILLDGYPVQVLRQGENLVAPDGRVVAITRGGVAEGKGFLLLHGPEPDLGWKTFTNAVVDLVDPVHPVEVGRWWFPGMWTAGGEEPTWTNRWALHHAVVAELRRRDVEVTVAVGVTHRDRPSLAPGARDADRDLRPEIHDAVLRAGGRFTHTAHKPQNLLVDHDVAHANCAGQIETIE